MSYFSQQKFQIRKVTVKIDFKILLKSLKSRRKKNFKVLKKKFDKNKWMQGTVYSHY